MQSKAKYLFVASMLAVFTVNAQTPKRVKPKQPLALHQIRKL